MEKSSVYCFSSCFWRHHRAWRSAVVAGLCFIYFFFAVLQVSSDGKRRDDLRRAGVTGLRSVPHGSAAPTRSNVVYITLRSKRHKPAIIRATVRPKLRKKKVRTLGRMRGAKGPDEAPGRTNSSDAWMRVVRKGLALYKTGRFDDATAGNTIRIYSRKPPPWLSQEDMAYMRSLANTKVRQLEELQAGGSGSTPVLWFRSAPHIDSTHLTDCSDGCGVIKPPVEMSEVFAFHLDRVLGLNRSLPTISRRFSGLDGQLCPVSLWDPLIIPVAETDSKLTWSLYQTSLKQKCWQRGIPKPEWSCTSIHHYEWSKMALFDFLLQIHQRLDRNCCGFRPRPEDSCVEHGYHGKCGNMNSVELTDIVLHRHNPRHLVFINNRGFFDRDEDNLDFKLLEGIKELPDVAVGVMSSQRLREKLLQSLFLDQQYWESQGGRQGIEKLIDVIERRAKVLLRYINAHDIKVIPMNA